MIVTVEGNIGAGKTTFAKALYENMIDVGRPVVYIPEPVESWTDFHGVNLLDMLYSDRKRWAFAFQVNALLHMTECDEHALEYVNKGFTVVRERSSFSTRNIFVPLLSECMSVAENHILEKLCTAIKDPCLTRTCSPCRASDITVYMRTDPETCYQRVTKRGRPEEVDGRVDLPYLIKLHEQHEQQVPKLHDSQCRLIVADGNTFNMDDPKSVKIFGRNDTVVNALYGQPAKRTPYESLDPWTRY